MTNSTVATVKRVEPKATVSSFISLGGCYSFVSHSVRYPAVYPVTKIQKWQQRKSPGSFALGLGRCVGRREGRPGAKLAPGLHPQAAPGSITSLSLLLLMNEFFVGYLQVTAVTKSLPAVGLTATRHTVLRPVPITLAIDKRNPTIISQTGPKHNCLLHLSLVATITGTSEIEC